MTPDEKQAFEEKIHAFVGREMGPPERGKDDVNAAMIRHWCEVMGDENPVYTDAEAAKNSSKQGLIAPPVMLQVWSMEGYPMTQEHDAAELDLQKQLHAVFDEHGYRSVVGTNCNQNYYRDLRPGDQITYHTVIDNISEEKATSLGIGYFIETKTEFTDQSGEKVGDMVFRVLKFKPNAQTQAAASGSKDEEPKAPTRIASPRGHDNKWWWDAIDNGKLLIQRCKSCQTLRHPPRPMCGECQSIEWDSIESTLEGEVYSFCEMVYPEFPGYQYPLVCVIVSLAEGTRLVSNIVGCEPSDVHIGMKVKGKVEQVDEATVLPQFYPA